MIGTFSMALFGGALLSTFLQLLCMLALHFLMPKAVLERYWKEPHFRPAELVLFTKSLLAPIRTTMLMAAIAFPRLGSKRQLTEAHRLVPSWYRRASLVMVVWTVSNGAVLLLAMVAVYAHAISSGDTLSWKLHVAMLTLMVCVALLIGQRLMSRQRRGDRSRRATKVPPGRRL